VWFSIISEGQRRRKNFFQPLPEGQPVFLAAKFEETTDPPVRTVDSSQQRFDRVVGLFSERSVEIALADGSNFFSQLRFVGFPPPHLAKVHEEFVSSDSTAQIAAKHQAGYVRAQCGETPRDHR
jgi:hypothetical protein